MGDATRHVATILALQRRLHVNDQPSQVIYGSQTRCPVLTGIWLPAVQGVATAGSDGTIAVYRVNKSSPSSQYVDGNVTDVERTADGVPANGLFDSTPSTPSVCIRGVTNRLSEFTEHSDAVWTLFNNEKAQDRSRFLLFSASASGSLLSHDLERGGCCDDGRPLDCVNRYPSHETEEGQDIILSLVSNERHSDHLFCGHHSGCSTMMDVETRQIVRTFTPHGDEWSGDAVGERALFEVGVFADDARVSSLAGRWDEVWEDPPVRRPGSRSLCELLRSQ